MAVKAFPAWNRILHSTLGWKDFENDRYYAQSVQALVSNNYLLEEITCIAQYGQFFTHAVIWLEVFPSADNPQETDLALLGALETHCFRLKSLVIYHPPKLSPSSIKRSGARYIKPLQRMFSFNPSLDLSLCRVSFLSEGTQAGLCKLLDWYQEHNVLQKVHYVFRFSDVVLCPNPYARSLALDSLCDGISRELLVSIADTYGATLEMFSFIGVVWYPSDLDVMFSDLEDLPTTFEWFNDCHLSQLISQPPLLMCIPPSPDYKEADIQSLRGQNTSPDQSEVVAMESSVGAQVVSTSLLLVVRLVCVCVCSVENPHKPGVCGKPDPDRPRICVDTCLTDSDCPLTDKFCEMRQKLLHTSNLRSALGFSPSTADTETQGFLCRILYFLAISPTTPSSVSYNESDEYAALSNKALISLPANTCAGN
ncbi:hypothetical protein C0Q70_10770 [Pomacea canaliculata]|uniref:Uncharacterized protein n=1 Tax=Pomacea canaliculata TaxID=400727 RepID=A0A2T7P435_POMCA|nr:hypothetical protein C0Q70_10770 [Pomacea canaliculata]